MANSLSTDWDKFYDMVMGEAAPEAETPVRVTPEGLNVYQRPVVAIDSNGNPIYAPPAGPPQGTKNARGSMPSADNSLAEPWGGTIDQFKFPRRDIVQNIPAPVMSASRSSSLDTIQPLDINNLGLTRQSFFAPQVTPAERAIAEITVNGGRKQGPWKGWDARTAIAAALSPPRMPMNKPAFVHPGIQQALAIGKAYTPSPKVQAALAAPAPQASQVIAQALSQPGYNGTNNVTSSELRPVHSSIFSENAMLPSGMNTRRWVGDGY